MTKKGAVFTMLMVGDNTRKLFEDYRAGNIIIENELELFEWLNKTKEVKGFDLRRLCLELNYTEFDYKRLADGLSRWKKRLDKEKEEEKEPTSPRTMSEKATAVTKGATDALFAEVKEIGALCVTEYARNAVNRGESLKDYIIKAVELREQYGDQIEALQQENDALRAFCSIFVEAAKPQFRQMAAARMYLDWTTGLIQLKALGVEVDAEYVNSVTARLEQALNVRLG